MVHYIALIYPRGAHLTLWDQTLFLALICVTAWMTVCRFLASRKRRNAVKHGAQLC
jgi:hypothetical protein